MFPEDAGAAVEEAVVGVDFPIPANILPPDGAAVEAGVESAAGAVVFGGPNSPLNGDGAGAEAVVVGVED